MSFKNLLLLCTFFFYSCHSQSHKSNYPMFLTTDLPPFSIASSNSNLFLAGPSDALVIDFTQEKSTRVLSDYHKICEMPKLGDYILPRIFKSLSNKIYFYCAASSEILLLLDDSHFTIEKRIQLPKHPVFNEVKFIQDKKDKIGILGIRCSLSLLTRCSSSFFIQLDADNDSIISSHGVTGDESEVILDVAYMENDELLILGYQNLGFISSWTVYHGNRKIKSFEVLNEESTNFINKISVINYKKQVLLELHYGIIVLNIETMEAFQIESSPSIIFQNIKTHNVFVFDENKLVFYDSKSETINLIKVDLDSCKKIYSYSINPPSKYFDKTVVNFLPFEQDKLLFSGIDSSYYYIFDFSLEKNPLIEFLPFGETIQEIYQLHDSTFSYEIIHFDQTSLLSKDSKFSQKIEHYDTVKVIIDSIIPNLIWKIGYMYGDLYNCYLDATDHLGTIMIHHPLPVYFCNAPNEYQVQIKSNPLNIWSFDILAIDLEYPGRVMYYSNNGWKEYDLSKNSLLSEILYTKISLEIVDKLFKVDFDQKLLYFYGVDDLGEDNSFAFMIKCHMDYDLKCDKDISILQSANQIRLVDLAYDTIGILTYKSTTNSIFVKTLQVGEDNSFISEQEIQIKINHLVIIPRLNHYCWFFISEENEVYYGPVETGANIKHASEIECFDRNAKIVGISDASHGSVAIRCQQDSSILFEFFNINDLY